MGGRVGIRKIITYHKVVNWKKNITSKRNKKKGTGYHSLSIRTDQGTKNI